MSAPSHVGRYLPPSLSVQTSRPRARVVVVGGGLAGLTAALACADAGASVTVLERQGRLGGLTWSSEQHGLSVDNGQHVFLRCCDAYLSFLERIGASGHVQLQPRLRIPVVRPGPDGQTQRGLLVRSDLRAPLHLARSLAGYRFLSNADRLGLGRAVLALSRLDATRPDLDTVAFGPWLREHGQSSQAINALWDLICLPTVNLPAEQASLAVAAKVFQTALLSHPGAADVGWSDVPLGHLHGDHAAAAMQKAGVEVHCHQRVRSVQSLGAPRPAVTAAAAAPEGPLLPASTGPWPGLVVRTERSELEADAVILAVAHQSVEALLPPGSLPDGVRPSALGSSPILDVHVHFDRQVTGEPFVAALDSPAQWIFDRTSCAGAQGQYLVVSVSAADREFAVGSDELGRRMAAALGELFPPARSAQVLGTAVTRERHATFRAAPGAAAHRPPSRTRIPGLCLAGAWTDTGWPATMEGAVLSGLRASRVALSATGHHSSLPKEAA